MNCFFCSETVPVEGKVSRQDTCPHCKRDLRCCKQCHFYDPGAYNECREISAERIVDKERANFCDYYAPRGERPRRKGINRTREAKAALEALFQKK